MGLEHRNETNDQVTIDAAMKQQRNMVLQSNVQRSLQMQHVWTEYDLKEMWKSPNGTIRAILDGTVFRAPIAVKGIEPCVSKLEETDHDRKTCIW